MTGHPHVTLAVDEGPALGAALLAAVGTGAYPTVADACHAAIQTVAGPSRTPPPMRHTKSITAFIKRCTPP